MDQENHLIHFTSTYVNALFLLCSLPLAALLYLDLYLEQSLCWWVSEGDFCAAILLFFLEVCSKNFVLSQTASNLKDLGILILPDRFCWRKSSSYLKVISLLLSDSSRPWAALRQIAHQTKGPIRGRHSNFFTFKLLYQSPGLELLTQTYWVIFSNILAAL